MGIRNKLLGQYRRQNKKAEQSPDMQDRVPPYSQGRHGLSLPLRPLLHKRPGLGVLPVCEGCGRTKDMWVINNGEGIALHGRRYCCRPCAHGKSCACGGADSGQLQPLGGLIRGASKKRTRRRRTPG